jgi:hypothetical protein
MGAADQLLGFRGVARVAPKRSTVLPKRKKDIGDVTSRVLIPVFGLLDELKPLL